METQLVRIVNRGFAGEPEHACLQNQETNEIYEFSQIVGDNINDADLAHPTIQSILNNDHQVSISIDENGGVVLHF